MMLAFRSLILLVLISLTLHGRADLIVECAPAYDPEHITWSSDGDRIITNSRRGELRVWQVSTGNLLQALPSIGRQGFQMTEGNGSDLLAYTSGGHAVILDRVASREIWRSPENTVSTIGPLAGDTIIYSIPDGIVQHNYKTGQQLSLSRLDDGRFCKYILPLANRRIAVVMFNRETLLFGGDDLKREGEVVGAGIKQFYSATSAPNGNLIALTTFEGAYGADLAISPSAFTRVGDMIATRSIAFSPDGMLTAIFGRSEIRISKRKVDELLLTIPCKASVNQMAWSNDSKHLAVASSDQGVLIFDISTGKLIRTFGKSDCFDPLANSPQCGISPDGGAIALQDEAGLIRKIDFVKMTNTVTDFPEDLDWATFGNLWSLKMSVASARRRYQAAGRFKGSFLDDRSALGLQWGGPGSFLFRKSSGALLYRWKEGEPVISAELPAEIGRRLEISNTGRYALTSKPGDDPGFNILKTPEWKPIGAVESPGGNFGEDSLVEARDGKLLSWIAQTNQLVSYNLVTSELSALRKFPLDSRPRALPTTSGETWIHFIEPATEKTAARHVIVSAESGKPIYQSFDWNSFKDEVDLVAVAVTPDCKHLWFCGPGGRPVLVALESGRALLRLHSWADGGLLFETPESKFAGNESGLTRIRSINESRTASEIRPELVNKALSTDEIRELLERIEISPPR